MKMRHPVPVDWGRKPENQGKIITRPTAGPCTLQGAAGAFCMLLGLGKYLRRAVAFGVCLHERLLYPGYDGSKVLAPWQELCGLRNGRISILLPSCPAPPWLPPACCMLHIPFGQSAIRKQSIMENHGYHHCNDHLYGDRCQCGA